MHTIPGIAALACLPLLLVSASYVSAQQNDRVLFIKDSDAADEASMKLYADVVEHSEARLEMLPIPGGTFTMGSPDAEPNRKSDEGPQHQVQVDPFWMSKYEITWELYDTWGEGTDKLRREVFGTAANARDELADVVTKPTAPYTDMSFKMGKGRKPAICMTQHAARKFCEWLSAKTGRYYRLPTEAEWEYACRAGTTTAWHFGDDASQIDDFAWFRENSDDKYHLVGQKKPNPWGLHDMHGNVAEWVLDQYYDEAYKNRAESPESVIRNPLVIPETLYPRVVRGGSFKNTAKKLRSASRTSSNEDWKEQDPQIPQSIWYHTDALGVGFRVVRPLVEPDLEQRESKWDKTAPVQLDPEQGE